MNQRLSLSLLCILLLASLAAAPALAATTACPSSCSCLLPAEAKKLGYAGYCSGKQAVCGYDAEKNEKYCYTKAVATTSPPVIEVVKTATATKPAVTTTVTTAPVQPCPDGCICLNAADGKAKGFAYCSGNAVTCGSGDDNLPMYCFRLPAAATAAATTTVTTAPTTAVTTGPVAPCGSGCSCVAPDKAGAAGFSRCSGSTEPCAYDPLGRAEYCYAVTVDRVTKVSPMPDATPAPPPSGTGTAVPINLPVSPPASAPAPAVNIFTAILDFFAGLFGPPRAADAPAPTVPGPAGPAVLAAGGCDRLGLASCFGTCADLQTDREHCGQCGNACYDNDEICCSGTCVKNTSAANCGGCGVTCPSGSVCQGGRCDAWGCYYGTTNCGGACVNLQSDPQNCGSCGNHCPANSVCDDGRCSLCPVNRLACDGDCVNSLSDRRNCGACRNTCADNALCVGGTCVACPEGETPCGDTCQNLMTSSSSCGACGLRCPEGTTCHDGVCGCPGSGQWCPGGVVGTGTCADLRTDRQHCGACNRRCAGDETCCAGECVNISTDAANCGGCGIACGMTETGPGFCDRQVCARCTTGSYRCRIWTDTGFTESCIDIGSDEQNCGACGHRCAEGEICCGGTCFDPQTSESHCGVCMNACGTSQQCCGGTCTDVLYNEDHCGSCSIHCIRPDRDHCIAGRCCNAAGLNCG